MRHLMIVVALAAALGAAGGGGATAAEPAGGCDARNTVVWLEARGDPGAGSAWSVRMENTNVWFDGGSYEFGLFYDDGARLYVDNVLRDRKSVV